MTKAVVFDVGRVLIQWDVNALYSKLLPDQPAIDAFLNEVPLLDWNQKFDMGTPFSEGVEALSKQFSHHEKLIRAFDERWIETIPGAVEGTVDILGRLKKADIPLYAITNFSAEKWPIACAEHLFLGNSFLDVIVSGAVKMLKPDERIYRLLIERNGLRAEDCFFTDDTPINVESARSVGMKSERFTTPKQLETDLRAFGFDF